MAEPLQRAFQISKTDLALLLTASLLAAAGATFAFGSLVDRVNRVRLLAVAIAGWGAVIAVSGFASSYAFLLGSRIAIGAATASATPAIASLIGDYFVPEERGAVYSTVLAGEVLGSGAGFLLAGELASWTWRAGFIALAAPAAALAIVVWSLPEPDRGGGALPPEHREHRSADARAAVRRQHVEPRSALVLHRDPARESLWWALKYVLRIPTNRFLILSSALGYFYFTGLRTFAVEYMEGWLGVSRGSAVVLLIAAGSGALAGVAVSGPIADRLLERGRLDARIVVAVVAYFASAGLFLLALAVRTLWLEIVLLAAAAAGLGAVNPPLDAARLDIMPPALWGRAESVRMCLRKLGEAAAPLTFGYLAEHVFAGSPGSGLHAAFLVMVVVLGAGGGVAIFAAGTYARDVATAQASTRRNEHAGGHREPHTARRRGS